MTDQDDTLVDGEPGSSSRIHIPQANRDLQSNWELDLAKNLEEYLLKICSGEVAPDQESSINFAEAALLLQGSVQVYSRKVEYLHSLVLAALDFLSQKRHDQQETPSSHPDGCESNAVIDDENEIFLGLDDIPVDPKNCLDRSLDREDSTKFFQKPPANLLVLEGDCLDSGDAGEFKSYLLATCNFYRDFLLLDPCDAGPVDNFHTLNGGCQEQAALHKGSSVRSKNRRSNISSPFGRTVGTPHKSSLGRNQGVPLDGNPEINHEANNANNWSPPPFNHDDPAGDLYHEEENIVGNDSDSDSDDPWKPLNPHEPGNLKIKPFKARKFSGRLVIRNSKQNTVSSQFPIAKMDGVINPELGELSEVQNRLQKKQSASQPPPYFEKLRRSFTNGEEETFDAFGGIENENDDNGVDDFPDFEHADFDLPNNTYDIDAELSPHNGKKDDAANLDGQEPFSQEDLGSQASLEDLCRSHLDALLASIAQTETQTELAARVSTWKQRIDQTLEEQDTHPPFDIHQYGKIVLDKLSSEAHSGGSMPFTDVVKGQSRHEVARTFSALLQLVNNGDIDLQRATSKELICYTAENPFTLKLLGCRRRNEEMGLCSSKKRGKSPSWNRCSNKDDLITSEAISPLKPSLQNGRLSVKLKKGSVVRCTPDGKRRRRSRLPDVIDLQPAG